MGPLFYGTVFYLQYDRGSAFQRGGLSGVVEEIGLDIDRISSRNLGRDNRVIGDHHRDCVPPFLDLDFVSFINDVPISTKEDYC